eukprot:TRINITY_DN46699_c0_g1_i1.p1 TRINITY_DN46699_c0_g1~~TRINITY_DN46699_c0_g1_i1.p1  ORF type:complete len:348 (+),score=-36.93 TRINITY_DN46699_c0_g1_i1:183-1226(+)
METSVYSSEQVRYGWSLKRVALLAGDDDLSENPEAKGCRCSGLSGWQKDVLTTAVEAYLPTAHSRGLSLSSLSCLLNLKKSGTHEIAFYVRDDRIEGPRGADVVVGVLPSHSSIGVMLLGGLGVHSYAKDAIRYTESHLILLLHPEIQGLISRQATPRAVSYSLLWYVHLRLSSFIFFVKTALRGGDPFGEKPFRGSGHLAYIMITLGWLSETLTDVTVKTQLRTVPWHLFPDVLYLCTHYFQCLRYELNGRALFGGPAYDARLAESWTVDKRRISDWRPLYDDIGMVFRGRYHTKAEYRMALDDISRLGGDEFRELITEYDNLAVVYSYRAQILPSAAIDCELRSE